MTDTALHKAQAAAGAALSEPVDGQRRQLLTIMLTEEY